MRASTILFLSCLYKVLKYRIFVPLFFRLFFRWKLKKTQVNLQVFPFFFWSVCVCVCRISPLFSSSHFNLFLSSWAFIYVIQPFCVDVERREKKHIWVQRLSLLFPAFCVTVTAEKRERWRGVREVINCFLSLKERKRGMIMRLASLLRTSSCTDTII